MVSTRPLIFKSSSPCTNSLVTVPSAPITTGITVTFKFHRFFPFSGKVQVLISLLAFLQFYPVISRNSEVHYSAGFLFFMTITRSGRLAEVRWCVCISKSQRSLHFSFFRTVSELCIDSYSQNRPLAQFPTGSCLVLCSFGANLLELLTMGLIVSSLSRHNLHLLFCCILSIFFYYYYYYYYYYLLL